MWTLTFDDAAARSPRQSGLRNDGHTGRPEASLSTTQRCAVAPDLTQGSQPDMAHLRRGLTTRAIQTCADESLLNFFEFYCDEVLPRLQSLT
jgi:hypothetical protein